MVLAVARAQPYEELVQKLMQAEPTEKFDSFCERWQSAEWVQNVSNTGSATGDLKTCDGLYAKTTADAEPVLVHARPMTGPDRPPGLFSSVATAAVGSGDETIISVCSQVAASVTEGAPNLGQCPETHPFPNDRLCCATNDAGGNTTGCLPCGNQTCTQPRHCPSGTVDGDLTISTRGLDQWFPAQLSDVVLAAQLYNPGAGFTADNTKVALVPNLDLGTGTRAFYVAMSDPDRLKRLCFAETPRFEATDKPPQPPPWTLALTFLGVPVPGQPMTRAVGPNVTMVHDGARVEAPDNHVVVTSAAVAFAWVLGASADLKSRGDVTCPDAVPDEPNGQQAALDLAQSQTDADTVHAWTLVDAKVRVGLPFASDAACLDVVDGVPSLGDMQMLCDVSAPDCVAVAIRPDRACLVVASQTADGISLPYRLEDDIDHPPDSVFTHYAVRNPVARDLGRMDGVAALGTTGDAAAAPVPGHTPDSCRALCWADPGCTAWTVVGTDCRTVGLEQTQPVVTRDGVNLECLERLGFDVGDRSGQCAGLPLDYAFSTQHNKCVHVNDLLLQPWCPEPWTTAARPQPGNNIADVPQVSAAGAAFASVPRATCACTNNPVATAVEHRVGASSPDGRTGVRCSGTGSRLRHPGAYSQPQYTAFRMFLEDSAGVVDLETFDCAVAETCADEAAARCEKVANCSGAIVDGATASVRIIAGVVHTSANTVESGPPTLDSLRKSTLLASEMPTPQTAGDTIFMTKFGLGPTQSTVSVGTQCEVQFMHFLPLGLVCIRSQWQKQADHPESAYGAVNCDDAALGDAAAADRFRFECVDRPLVATGGAPTLGDTLVAGHANEDFVGAVPVAHGGDRAALYVGKVEQCVSPDYLMRMGPVVRTQQQQGCAVVEVGASENWKNVQVEHPSMVREVMQLTGCLETDLQDAADVPSRVQEKMSDLFEYAFETCNRALTMHGTATLGEFLEDGGNLLNDVYRTAGCEKLPSGMFNTTDSKSSFLSPSAPMSRYYVDAVLYCNLEVVNRTQCCGSPGCTPPYCKKLTGSVPLPRCRVTIPYGRIYFEQSEISMSIGPTASNIFPASNCNDGDLTNFCASDPEAFQNAFLIVDLGSPQAIEAVEIYNRADCCQERFGDHVIELSNTTATFAQQCFTGKLPSTFGPHTETCRGVARFIRLRMLSVNSLNLAEVKVQIVPTCNRLSSWRRVAPTGGAVQTGPSDAETCTDVNVGQGASNVSKATKPDPGCNAEHPHKLQFNFGLEFCYALPQGNTQGGAVCSCACVGCGQSQPLCQDTVPCPGQAAVLPSGLPDYAVPYPEVLAHQIVAAAPKGYECFTESVPQDVFFLEDNANGNTMINAWYTAGCFNKQGMPGDSASGVPSDLAKVLGEMRATCLEAQQGVASAEVACCGRVGCGAVLSCPVHNPLPVPLPVCTSGLLARRAGSGFTCHADEIVAGVLCRDVCAMQRTLDCVGKTAVDIDGVGCMLMPQQECTQALTWDDPDAFPCAAGIDTQGRACIGAPDLKTKTCIVMQGGKKVSSACPDHVADVRHAPWAFEQQPGACASTVFTGKEEELVTTTQDTWQKCERQADLAGADEFSYDDATQQCVVNKANTACITTLDVVDAVREKSVFGESRPDATGTDLRAWIGQDGELGAAAVLQDVVTAPQVLESDFVCMPKDQCKTRDVHGRCISLTSNALSDCQFVPVLIPRVVHPCANGCDGDDDAATNNDLMKVIRGGINQCLCNEKRTRCTNPGSDFNHGAGVSVDAFLDESRTQCALLVDSGLCGLNANCVARKSSAGRHAAKPTTQGTITSDTCDYCESNCPAQCTPVNQNGGPNQPMPEYTLPELSEQQQSFHNSYAKTQESLLGQEYASTFYRSWVSHPWNRDRFMAAAGRHNKANEGDRPFYASAIWSGPGGKDWDDLQEYDKRWLGGAAAVGPFTFTEDTLTNLRTSDVPNAAHGLTPFVEMDFFGSTGENLKGSVEASGPFKAYFQSNVTPMWSPLRAWLLGVRDPFLDKDEANIVNVKPRASKITEALLDRIVAFRGRVPDKNSGAELLREKSYDRQNAANECLSECENDDDCVAISLRSALMATDTEPLNFVNTGGGLGVQGSEYFRPQRCGNQFQPHLSSFQYNILKLCPTTMIETMNVMVDFKERATTPFNQAKATTQTNNLQLIIQSVFSGGLNSSPFSGQAMSGQPDPQTFFTGKGFKNPLFFEANDNEYPDPNTITDRVPTYGQEWMHSMMGSIGEDCSKQTTGPSSYKGQSTTLGDQRCHIRLGLHHCDFCWKSQPTGDGKLGTASSTPTRKPVAPPQIKCHLWRHAPLTSLGRDAQGSTITAFDGDSGGTSRGASKTLDLNQHDADVPSDMMELGKARLQRPTPVRFKYTTIYLPKDAIDVDKVTDGGKTTTATRYTRRAKPPTHTVHRSHDSNSVARKPTRDDTVVPNDNPQVATVLRTASQVLQDLGVPANDDTFWVQRSTVCNYRQHDRPVFTSVRCPQNMPMTCALPWPVYAQNIMTNANNQLSPTDYRSGSNKCVPVVAVCLQAEWRYAGIQGESLCSAAGRLLEIKLDREPGTTPNIDLQAPPHVSGGSYAWPVSWLQPDIEPSNLPPHSAPFRTRRPEPTTNTVFAACPDRKPCNQPPCPTGMGLLWTADGNPFCTRVGSGSRGFQQATRDVPKSVHAARQSFGGFLADAGAVSGTGPALYNGTAACNDNGCGGIINSHCEFNHVSDRQFPSCQSASRITQACCSAQARLDIVDMTEAELRLMTAPKTVASVVQPRATCEATLGLACGNAEFALRLPQHTQCTCDQDSCTADTLGKVQSASMPELDTDTSVVVTQGHRCGRRVRWAPQYLSMGSGVARCNGVDDLTKGGAPVDATGAQLCGCRRGEAPDDDARWPGVCESPRGCAVHGIFEPSGDGATCDGDIVVNGDAATITSQFGSDVANWCSHECLHRGATCWAFDSQPSSSSSSSSPACVLHVQKTGCVGTPRFKRQRAVYAPIITNQDATRVATPAASPAPAPKPDECADRCAATPGCTAWAHDSDTKICHLASAVRRYVLRVGTLNFTVIEDPNAERQILYNADFDAFLQSLGVNTSEPVNGTLVALLLENNTFVSNHTEEINFTTQENEDILANATLEIDLSCDRDLGTLDTSDLQRCAQQCDAGHDSHGCTGFTVSVNGTCTLCAGGGEFVAERLSSAVGNDNATFHAIASGENQVVHRELIACQQACESTATCGHCVIVRSTVGTEQPRYVEIGAQRKISNMPRRDVYPWITSGHTKWDDECCTRAPCGQSHGPSAFGMGVCPGPALDAENAGPHAMSVLDTNAMQCVTRCTSGFANPPACDQCAQANFDPATNCTQCLGPFALASDGACSLCKDPRRDIAGTPPCQHCLPGFRVSQGGACQEWTCDARLDFGASTPSVTETTDVVLALDTGERMATGGFVGVADGRVPASLRSTLVRHRGNVYLLGNGVRFLVAPQALGTGNDDVVHDVLPVGSDWLDGLPMADSSHFQQPLNRSVLMAPGASGVLGHHRCGASGVNVSTILSPSQTIPSTKQACLSVTGALKLCSAVTQDGAASSPRACSQACVLDKTCVSFVHQAESSDTYTQESIGGAPEFRVSTQATCQLYTAQQAADADRPRNIMVEDGRCSGAGLRVPGEGLVSYAAGAGQPQVKPIEEDLQFRVVRAVDLLGETAGCWVLTRWHRHRVVPVDNPNVTAAQDACQGNDTVTTEYLEHHAPMQGNDVRGDALVGFMPRAPTGYAFVAGGVVVSNATTSSPACVALCAHGFATEWHAIQHRCVCFADDQVARVGAAVPFDGGVVLTGRRPTGGRVLGPGPVPSACNVSGTDTGATDVTGCAAHTSRGADGFVLGPGGCQPLQCDAAGAQMAAGGNGTSDIVQLHRHPVERPVAHDRLAFGDMDVPVSSTAALDAAACCAKCNDNNSAANSYRFQRATGTCECFDARARVCARNLPMVVAGRCRFCTNDLNKAVACVLGSLADCAQETRTLGKPLCNGNQSFVTFAGAGVSQGCTGDQLSEKALPTLGCDRAAGCVMTTKDGNENDYFCTPASRINTDTREWDKPPRAIQVGVSATQVPSLDDLCAAHGYGNGTCTADRVEAARHRIASCECALATGAGGQSAISACQSATCGALEDTKAVWCCDAPSQDQQPCGAAATASAVVADITTVFTRHDSRTAIATLKHDNVCSATAGLAQTFSLVRCAPNQCMSMGSLVQNALFVVSSQNPNELLRVPNDDCTTCDLCNFPTQYRSAHDVQQLTLATGNSTVDAACPAHMPHPVATQCVAATDPVTEECRPGADPAATPNACSLTTWGGPPLCCRQGQACLNQDGQDMRLPTCRVLPQLQCAQLRDPCPYQQELKDTACQALASVVLRDVADISACQRQCDVAGASPCLLYEYEASSKLCLLGKANSAGMRACATDHSTHQEADGVTLVIKVPPPDAVCDSASLRHFSQPTHVADFGRGLAPQVVLSSVAQEHQQLYGALAPTKVKRLYGTFGRSYNFERKLQPWLPPFDTLCNSNGTNCPGTQASVLGHLVAHPGFSDGPGQSESMVFQPTVGTVSDSDNAAVVASAAVMTRPGNAGSDACITQAELSVQGTATLGAVSERFENSAGRGWVDGVNATSENANATQIQCLEACVSRSPPCVAFQHNSLDPLQPAACQLYVGRRLAIANMVEPNQASGSTVYITSGVESCTSPEQCVHVSKTQSAAALQQQTTTFQDALKRCQQETFDADTGRPKLMGRATYVNVVQCPSGGPKPTPVHLELHDHEAGVLCWSDKVAAPGKRGASSNRANFYPFNGPQPVEPQDQDDAPPTPAPLDFRVDNDTFGPEEQIIVPAAGCNFQQFKKRSAVVGQSPGPSFVDLKDVLDCGADSRTSGRNTCESDNACTFQDQAQGPSCTYQCTPERCANTLLCRGYVEPKAGGRKCLFLRAGTQEGTMQPPSALQPCLVTGLHRILVQDEGSDTFLKVDCCTGVV